MKAIGLLFPGQGSQYAGMGRELAESFPESRETLAEADEVLSLALSRLCFEGPEQTLNQTEVTQPAVLAVSVAALRALEGRGVRAQAVAGHSLGEYTALVAAGSLPFADALRLVRNRGRYMQEAVPVGQGSMAAIVGLEAKLVVEICQEAERGEVVVAANFNAPDQTVISGGSDGVKRAVALAEARGAKRVVMLPVSAPFHSPLMAPAAARLWPELEATGFDDLRVPLVNNVDAELVRDGARARDALIRQVTGAVRWTEVVGMLRKCGIGSFIEVGPGRVLSGLVRRIDREVGCRNVEDPASLEKTLRGLEGAA